MDLLGPAAASWRKEMTRRRYGRDEVLFREGDVGDTLHVIEKGRVLVQVSTDRGERTAVAVRGPGDVIGELSLFEGGVRTATVIALERTETLVLSHASLNRLRQEDPKVDRYLAELLSSKLAEVTDRMMEMLFLPADRRVLRVLVRLANVYGTGSDPTTVVVRQEDLASMAGTGRQTISRPLREAEEAGAIRVGRGRITIDDLALLDHLADQAPRSSSDADGSGGGPPATP
jgi:CRP/FNR family cyclic AMP-dependent transcriptional regulator